jgi:hypothetical protein
MELISIVQGVGAAHLAERFKKGKTISLPCQPTRMGHILPVVVDVDAHSTVLPVYVGGHCLSTGQGEVCPHLKSLSLLNKFSTLFEWYTFTNGNHCLLANAYSMDYMIRLRLLLHGCDTALGPLMFVHPFVVPMVPGTLDFDVPLTDAQLQSVGLHSFSLLERDTPNLQKFLRPADVVVVFDTRKNQPPVIVGVMVTADVMLVQPSFDSPSVLAMTVKSVETCMVRLGSCRTEVFSLRKECWLCRTETPKQCGKCRVAYYCGPICQKLHRAQHKPMCKEPSESFAWDYLSYRTADDFRITTLAKSQRPYGQVAQHLSLTMVGLNKAFNFVVPAAELSDYLGMDVFQRPTAGDVAACRKRWSTTVPQHERSHLHFLLAVVENEDMHRSLVVYRKWSSSPGSWYLDKDREAHFRPPVGNERMLAPYDPTLEEYHLTADPILGTLLSFMSTWQPLALPTPDTSLPFVAPSLASPPLSTPLSLSVVASETKALDGTESETKALDGTESETKTLNGTESETKAWDGAESETKTLDFVDSRTTSAVDTHPTCKRVESMDQPTSPTSDVSEPITPEGIVLECVSPVQETIDTTLFPPNRHVSASELSKSIALSDSVTLVL